LGGGVKEPNGELFDFFFYSLLNIPTVQFYKLLCWS